ncbi:AAA family ATPase [Maritimibacter sp. DP1N21-5]|uniref:AAA family ATPase n=1 Tax=Maritimibacter sp. DP1N21-5 TaxID=2836867 RepID=UPI001C45859A|nr:AAA family ATPase [Maritimibacter sp. DP1N21-5]MBV7409625.1 helicase RepA family protein [Maritimibacter sp. DP1N21-5]
MADQPQWGSDEWVADNIVGPTADAARERLALDPETRRAEYEARRADAEARRSRDDNEKVDKLLEMQREATKTAEKELEKEQVKKGTHSKLPPQADPNSIELEFAMSDDTANITLNYLLDPFLPERCVVGFYGRGSSAKSSFVASMAAAISANASTLWISVEELTDWIKVRHTKAGGADRTLQVVKAVAVKKDHQGRTIGSNFNVYEHLAPAIVAASMRIQNLPAEQRVPPLRLVVLDTAVGLTTWTSNAGPNSDEGVKKLMAYLQGLAEAHNLTVAVIGHANKGKHDHIADSVMGATAWVNSPRLSLLHAADQREEHEYVAVVAKTNLAWFGIPYKTTPVHVLYERAGEMPDSVLVKVEPGAIVWGRRGMDELWHDATTIPKDDEGGFEDRRKLTVAEIVRNKLVEMVHAGKDPHIMRAQVECQLPDVKVNRAQWAKVDMDLRQFPFIHKVEVTTGSGFNMILYRPISDEVQK